MQVLGARERSGSGWRAATDKRLNLVQDREKAPSPDTKLSGGRLSKSKLSAGSPQPSGKEAAELSGINVLKAVQRSSGRALQKGTSFGELAGGEEAPASGPPAAASPQPKRQTPKRGSDKKSHLEPYKIDPDEAYGRLARQSESLINNGYTIQVFHPEEGIYSKKDVDTYSLGSISSASSKDCEIMFKGDFSYRFQAIN